MTDAHPFPVVADATALFALLGERPARRVLLFGAPGTGKSTLAAYLARALVAAGHRIGGIGADPGSPPFGPPGAVSYGDESREAFTGPCWPAPEESAMTTPDAPSTAFRFCPGCGGLLEVRAIRDTPRQVCCACGRVVYRHPAVGVAVGVRRGATLLFGRRAGGPYLTSVGFSGVLEKSKRDMRLR